MPPHPETSTPVPATVVRKADAEVVTAPGRWWPKPDITLTDLP
jgi:hypothetical protein